MTERLVLPIYIILISLVVANGCHIHKTSEQNVNDSLKYYYHMEGPNSSWTTYTKEQRDSIMFKRGHPVQDDTTNHVGDIRYWDSINKVKTEDMINY